MHGSTPQFDCALVIHHPQCLCALVILALSDVVLAVLSPSVVVRLWAHPTILLL